VAKYAYPGRENLQAMSVADNYNRRLREFLLAALHNNEAPVCKVLDFGAGTGIYARMLRDSGLEVECLEPDEEYSILLRADGFRVHGELAALDVGYQLIYAMNVLEHIEEDERVFTSLARCLAPGGSLVVYVPAFDVLSSSMDRLVGHLRRYRAVDLLEYSAHAGLRVSSWRYCDPIGFFASLLYRAVGDKSGAISSRSVRLYDRTAFRLGSFLEPFTGRLFGKNLLVIARRSDN
jgi:SAM-dependent methyltransferase